MHINIKIYIMLTSLKFFRYVLTFDGGAVEAKSEYIRMIAERSERLDKNTFLFSDIPLKLVGSLLSTLTTTAADSSDACM